MKVEDKKINRRSRKSDFIHEFTKTPSGIVCPHFYVLAHANGCPYACDYCYLQLTFRYQKEPVIFTNRQDLIRDVNRFLEKEKPSVLSAGELSDALAFDHITGLSKDLIPLFAEQDKHKLLFLTKSANVENLLGINQRRNIIVSFSLNAPFISAMHEHGAPNPLDRVDAARKCQEAGYEVRLRIDPVIPIPGWKDHYKILLNYIKLNLNCEGMRFTIGSIRYFKSLPDFARSRGRNVEVFKVATSCEGADRRMRVTPQLRLEIYSWFCEQLPNNSTIALCKETIEIWKKLGWNPIGIKCNCAP